MGLLLLGLPEAVFPLLLLPLLQGGGVVKDQGKVLGGHGLKLQQVLGGAVQRLAVLGEDLPARA